MTLTLKGRERYKGKQGERPYVNRTRENGEKTMFETLKLPRRFNAFMKMQMESAPTLGKEMALATQ